mmetsp:Transcript_8437/g.16401  ORF Transcript_8437/g.16401 Transcript_8437/m.16401 type:complete len:207 (-) Transcript_8437:273-893(-)
MSSSRSCSAIAARRGSMEARSCRGTFRNRNSPNEVAAISPRGDGSRGYPCITGATHSSPSGEIIADFVQGVRGHLLRFNSLSREKMFGYWNQKPFMPASTGLPFSVRHPVESPPGFSDASRRVTLYPASVILFAAPNPAHPPPMITTFLFVFPSATVAELSCALWWKGAAEMGETGRSSSEEVSDGASGESTWTSAASLGELSKEA